MPVIKADFIPAGQCDIEKMRPCTFVEALFIGSDFTKGPFDTLEGGFSPLLAHLDVLARFGIVVRIDILRQPGAENAVAILNLPEGLRLQGRRHKEKK